MKHCASLHPTVRRHFRVSGISIIDLFGLAVLKGWRSNTELHSIWRQCFPIWGCYERCWRFRTRICFFHGFLPFATLFMVLLCPSYIPLMKFHCLGSSEGRGEVVSFASLFFIISGVVTKSGFFFLFFSIREFSKVIFIIGGDIEGAWSKLVIDSRQAWYIFLFSRIRIYIHGVHR